jgi:hypothetical protein
MKENYQAKVLFAELARSAVDLYLDQLVAKLNPPPAELHPLPPGDRTLDSSCRESIIKLLKEDLRPAFIHDLAELLQNGSGVRIASKDALERFLSLFGRQLEHIADAAARAKPSGPLRDGGTTPSCFDLCLEDARNLSERFPENYQAIVAVDARRLAGVSLFPQPPVPEGRLFSGAPHNSLWPTQRRVRIVDEHSVSAPTYRWGSRGYR